MNYSVIIYEKKDNIAYITLNRPESLNAMTTQMSDELDQAWEEFKKDDGVRVAILSGAGEKAFCAGADLKEAAIRSREPGTGDAGVGARGWRFNQGFYPSAHGLLKPVIAAVHGIACAGGLSLTADADIAICSEDATFFAPQAGIGLVPPFSSTFTLTRIPYNIALRMLFMGGAERMSAQRAYEAGLVTQVVPKSQLLPTANNIAKAILKNAPLSITGIKQVANLALTLPYREAMAAIIELSNQARTTDDFFEGVRSFAEKRKPDFKGK